MAKDRKKKKSDTNDNKSEVSGTLQKYELTDDNSCNAEVLRNSSQSNENQKVVPEQQCLEEEPPLSRLIVVSYNGDLKKGIFHGVGSLLFANGNKYKGEFIDGKMHGSGTFIWPDKIVYEGEFFENRISGRGRYLWPDGSSYDGEVLNGLRHGKGTYVSPNSQFIYTGDWVNGTRHGQGSLFTDSKDEPSYRGDFFNNMKHGFGVRRYKSENIYKGGWYKNFRHGRGLMRWINRNETYDGDWEYGLPHGFGEQTWHLKRVQGSQYPLRNQYYGEFVKGKRDGYGTFIYASGAKYVGHWKNNLKHGDGEITFKNGRVYKGLFQNDVMVDHPNFKIDGLVTPDINSIRTTTPIGDISGSVVMENGGTSDVSTTNTISPGFKLSIDDILDNFPPDQRETESIQVKFTILRHVADLRLIYNFYASLGKFQETENTFVMTRLQFWRFIRDCKIHQYDLSIIEMDRILDSHHPLIHSLALQGNYPLHMPNDKFLFLDFINALITLSYKLFSKDFVSETHELAACLSHLIMKNVFPHACHVNGMFLSDPHKTKIALHYVDRCFAVYGYFCKDYQGNINDLTMKYRDIIFMLKDLHLVNNSLNMNEILKIISYDDPRIYDGEDCNLEIEASFLEFFEALLRFAELSVPTPNILDESGSNSGSEGTLQQPSNLTSQSEGDADLTATTKTNKNAEKTTTSGADFAITETEDVTQKLTLETSRTNVSIKSESTMDVLEEQSTIRPLTQGQSHRTSVKTFLSNYSDWLADFEDMSEMSKATTDWTHQLYIFFRQKFFTAFEQLIKLHQLMYKGSTFKSILK